jgi:hypothetical protein
MAADLFIERIHQPLMQQYEPLFEAAIRRRNSFPPKSKEAETAHAEVTKYYDLMFSEGYFRDSYNSTNLLSRLGLSWWQDVSRLCTLNQKLRQDRLRRFREMVANAKLQLPSKEELEKDNGKLDEQGENSLAEWHKYFVEKHAELFAFLDKAIELNSPIHCSL